ncbi:MAG: HDOD domain-containing protein [Betaproteobacteria bacterium]|nr:HDOD domain-containing protein [Betaproteobacteria bacterium]
MTITAGELVKDIDGLVTLPDVYIRINRLLENPNSSTTDIAKAVSQDPSFTLRLLRVANSSLYRFPAAVTTAAKAVSIIGTAQIRSLALAMSVAKSFAGMPNELVSMENFWRHSLYCALIARHLAREARRCDPDSLFTAGLLHDIGELVIFNRLPEQAKDALLMVLDSQDEMQVHEAERKVMGVDHAEVGGELARHWNLPSLLQECIAHHHAVASAKQHPREVALVHLANVFALMAEVDSLDPGDVSPIDPLAWELTGLSDDCVDAAVREAQAEIHEAEQLFS